MVKLIHYKLFYNDGKAENDDFFLLHLEEPRAILFNKTIAHTFIQSGGGTGPMKPGNR